MEMERNGTYVCRVTRVNNEKTDYLGTLTVDEEYTIRIEIKEVERKCFDKIKDAPYTNIVINWEGKYITIVDCQLTEKAFRGGPDINNTKMYLKYISSLLLVDYLWDPAQKIQFSGFSCSITEITELLGNYPYKIDYDQLLFPNVECNVKGNVVSKKVGHGFSYFVAPSITYETDGMHVSMYGKIQYSGGREQSVNELREVLHKICLFFEILSGEIITVNEIVFEQDKNYVKAVGFCNFPKSTLNGLQSSFDTRKYLRKSIFKVTDFGNDIGKAIASFCDIQSECMLACEAYKQILLDEEIKISTYNKFLKVMQVVEGFQRAKIYAGENLEFQQKKNSVLEKLNDEEDKAFLEKYTNYNGQSFRKCMNGLTVNSLQVISGLTKGQARKNSDDIIDAIIKDRDVYTHASKEEKPRLSIDKLQAVNYCYKTFFRVMVLSKMGLTEKLIRNRLLFDRKFVAFYQMLFGLKILKEDSHTDTGDFDDLMW